jgi:hypothetical protein
LGWDDQNKLSLKADEELRNSFNDVKLNEIDEVKSELVKLAGISRRSYCPT